MKTRGKLLGSMLVSALLLGAISCSESPVVPAEDLTLKSGNVGSTVVYPALLPDEETGILQMREEEKMAHDVYVDFYAKWSLPEFLNISESETNHYTAVYTLISAYGLTDPSTGVVGTFNNTVIAEMYAQLIAAGETSEIEALKAGALIEETDILDLEKLLAATSNSAIINVYSNLLSGSRNHLRTFVSALANLGVTYVPQNMDQEAFDAIISSPMEQGYQKGKNNGNGARNGGGNGTGYGNGNGVNGSASGQGTGAGNGSQGSGGQNGPGNGTGVCING